MIEEGKKAPAFFLESSHGGKLRLSQLLGKWAVIYAYPRDNTSGCTVEAEGFRDALPEFEALSAVVLGVSKDSIASHERFSQKYDLNFALLSDPAGSMLEKYGSWGEKKMYGKTRMGIIRSTFLVDPKGRLARVWPKVRVKGHVDEVLTALRERAK